MERLTKEQVTAQPWKYSPDQWQSVMGVHRPHIGEISQHQYARLSNRGKSQYDAKRSREWGASANCRRSWYDAVTAAHDAGLFSTTDEDVSYDARIAVNDARERRAEAALQLAWRTTNNIKSMDEVNVGDRVFLIVGSRYGTVVKKNQKTVNVAVEGWDRPYKHHPESLRWLSYQDLKETISA